MKSREELRAPYWERLRREVGDDITDALRDFYELYTDELIDWFAGIYDVNIGGYYYSNSARDNEGFLPDAESTCQALGFWNDSGMSAECGGGFAGAVPEWMGEDICRFISSLQDADGFFYHPQWGKDISISRRARDLNWCVRILNSFGKAPEYPTIFDTPQSESGESQTLIPEHLSSPEKFDEYLVSLNLNQYSYSKGSELSSQIAQIQARGLDGQLIAFLNATQHPETGLWHDEANYYGVNGLMKLSGIYVSTGNLIPNAMNAAASAADAIISDEPTTSVVCLWNTWVAVSRVCAGLRKSGGEIGARQAEEIVKMMRERGVACIKKSKEKLAPFKKADGAFSYKPDSSSPTSQGVPVAIKGTPEGDVNATVIASSLMLNSIYNALNVPNDARVPMFFECDRRRYVELLNKKHRA